MKLFDLPQKSLNDYWRKWCFGKVFNMSVQLYDLLFAVYYSWDHRLVIIQQITLFGSHLWTRSVIPRGQDVDVSGMTRRGIVHRDGLCLFGNDGKPVSRPHNLKLIMSYWHVVVLYFSVVIDWLCSACTFGSQARC